MDNFTNVKVGDKVFFNPDNFGSYPLIIVVTKITDTMIICNKYRFEKDTGNLVRNKDSFHFPHIEILTKELLEQYNKNIILIRIQKIDFTTLTYAQLKEVEVLVKKFKGDINVQS